MQIEFRRAGHKVGSLIAACKSESCPDVGEKVSIRGETWLVVSRSWALDHSDDAVLREMRANLNCERADDGL